MVKPVLKKSRIKVGDTERKQFTITFGDTDHNILLLDNHFNMETEQAQNTLANVCFEICSTLRKNRKFTYMETRGLTSKEIEQVVERINPKAVVFLDIAPFGKLSLDKSKYFYYLRDWKNRPTILTPPISRWADEASYEASGQGAKALIGFHLKFILRAAEGKNPFYIDLSLINTKPRVVWDIRDFDKLMDVLETKNLICTDVEGDNLSTITNTMFTLQIGFWHRGKVLSYVIPWRHHQFTWDKRDFAHIKKRLRKLFMREDVENVMSFGQFDIGQLCHELDMDVFLNDIYDIPSAEFALDENHKFIKEIYASSGDWEKGYKPYALEFVEYRYGIFRPADMIIGKEDRANMKKFSIEEIAEYGGFDTCFSENTYVETEVGKINIKEFINLKEKPKVLSFNHVTKEKEYKNVLFTSVHKNTKRMVEINYSGGSIRVTEDHKIWSNTRNDYINAIDLQEDEDVEINNE